MGRGFLVPRRDAAEASDTIEKARDEIKLFAEYSVDRSAFAHGARLTLGITQSTKGGRRIIARQEMLKTFGTPDATTKADAMPVQDLRTKCECPVAPVRS